MPSKVLWDALGCSGTLCEVLWSQSHVALRSANADFTLFYAPQTHASRKRLFFTWLQLPETLILRDTASRKRRVYVGLPPEGVGFT